MNINRRQLILGLLVVLVAAIPRVGWPGLTDFKYDEAQMVRSAILLLREGKIPAYVESSVAGLPYPPLMVYVLSLPLLIVRDPAAAVIFLALLSVGAVALTLAFGTRYYNTRVAMIAAVLFAAAPWAIFYGRKIWAQDIPILSLVLMWGLYRFVIDRKLSGGMVAAVMAVVLAGMHLGNAVFILILFLAVILHPSALREALIRSSRNERVGIIVAGSAAIGLVVLLMAPWIKHVALGTTTGSLQALVDGDDAAHFRPLEQAELAAMVATGYRFAALAGDQTQAYRSDLPFAGAPALLDQIEVWLIWFSAAYVIIRAGIGRLHESGTLSDEIGRYTLLSIWLVTPVAIWTVSKFAPQPHRYIALYPAQFLALAVLADDALAWIEAKRGSGLARAVSGVLAAMLVVLVSWQMVAYATLLRLVDATVINYGHGPAAAILWEAARDARRLASEKHLPIVVNGTGDNPAAEGEAAAFDALLGDLDLRLIEGEAVTLKPPQGMVHIYTRADAHYDVEVIAPREPARGGATIRLANGVEFVQIQPSGLGRSIGPGERLPFSLVWRIWGIPPENDDYSYTVQLFDENWLRWVNINDHFLRTAYWRVGDEVVTSGWLEIPNDAPRDAHYQLVLTLYTLAVDGAIQPVSVLDELFNPAGEFIVVPLD